MMEVFFTNIFQFFLHDKWVWELLAVVLSIAYLVLAIREKIWCWPAAFLSTAIYTWLFWHVALLMDSALNVYYMLMAMYGWWVWYTPRDAGLSCKASKIVSWGWKYHVVALSCVITASVVSGTLLKNHTQAAWPFVDSLTTWGSVLATYMVAKKVLENWLYWVVIDALAMALYIERGLYATALLFAIYMVMAIFGYFAWKNNYGLRKNKNPHTLDNVVPAAP